MLMVRGLGDLTIDMECEGRAGNLALDLDSDGWSGVLAVDVGCEVRG